MDATTTTEPTYFDLGKTDSYSRRRVGWFAGDRGRLGTMRVICQRGEGPGNSDSVDEYGVEEDTPEGQLEPRVFLLENYTSPDPDGPFVCEVGALDTCFCEAGRIDQQRRAAGRPEVGCKHRSAVRKLIESGLL